MIDDCRVFKYHASPVSSSDPRHPRGSCMAGRKAAVDRLQSRLTPALLMFRHGDDVSVLCAGPLMVVYPEGSGTPRARKTT